MLKIKDNVDLKELEKFGFELDGNTYHIQSMINAEIRELEWILSILKG